MGRLGPTLVAALLLLTGCNGDDDDGGDGPDPSHAPASTVAPVAGDLAVAAPTGWFPVPVPSLGFGLALPEQWQATVLTESALTQLEESGFPDTAFVRAARRAQAEGALLYAAGREEADGVADVKLFREPAPADGLLARARRPIDTGAVTGTVEEADGRARLRFTADAPSADDPELEVASEGTEWFVPDGDLLWRVLIISEDAATHDDLALQLVETLVFAAPEG
jgi:hypothetical protein